MVFKIARNNISACWAMALRQRKNRLHATTQCHFMYFLLRKSGMSDFYSFFLAIAKSPSFHRRFSTLINPAILLLGNYCHG